MDSVDPIVLAERRAVRAELAEKELLERVRRAERRIAELEDELDEAARRVEQAEADRAAFEGDTARLRSELRRSEQREFAEQQRRIETEEDLSTQLSAAREQASQTAEGSVAAGRRVEELSRQVSDLQHALDDARAQAEAAAHRARVAERRVQELEALRQAAMPSSVAAYSATGSAVPVPSRPPEQVAADLDAAAERLRQAAEASPEGNDAPEPEAAEEEAAAPEPEGADASPPAEGVAEVRRQRRGGLLRRRR